MPTIFFIHSSVEGHLGCFCFFFWLLRIILPRTFRLRLLREHMFSFSGVCTRERNGWVTWSLLRTCQNVSQSIFLHVLQQCMRAPISPDSCQHFSFSVFLMASIPVGVTWDLCVGRICISLPAKDIELLLCAYRPLRCLMFGDASVLLLCPSLSYENAPYILDTRPLSDL